MEANAPTVRPRVELKGTVHGNSMTEITECANTEAWEFFKHYAYTLNISAQPINEPGLPRFVATYWAELAQ